MLGILPMMVRVTSTKRRLCFFLDPHWRPVVLYVIVNPKRRQKTMAYAVYISDGSAWHLAGTTISLHHAMCAMENMRGKNPGRIVQYSDAAELAASSPHSPVPPPPPTQPMSSSEYLEPHIFGILRQITDK